MAISEQDARPANDYFGLRRIFGTPSSKLLWVMLVVADVYFLARHIVDAARGFELSLHYIDYDFGHAESFSTVRWIWLIGLVAFIILARRRWIFTALVPILGFMLLTDSLQLHEEYGAKVAFKLGIEPMFGLRPEDFGELLVLGTAGIVVLPIAVYGWWKARGEDRRHLTRIAVLLALVIAFGVVLDQLHIVLIDDPGPGDWFGILEDGGEMLAASTLLAYVFSVATGPARVEHPVPGQDDNSAETSTVQGAPER